jgi:serine/threonine protein kinase
MSRLGTPRNLTKASVRIERRNGTEVIVKDFGHRAWAVRALVGRPSLRREERAYRILEGVPGVPRCLGFEGPDTLLIERAPGHSMSEWRVQDLPAGVLDSLEERLALIHARGVALVDLHRSNVVVSEQGDVSLVDFALAAIGRRRGGGLRPGWWIRVGMRLDRHALARIRSRAEGAPRPVLRGWLGLIYRAGRSFKSCIRGLKGLGRP